MSAAVHVSLAEYMSTDYEPDCDYVDGRIEERNVGKQRHSRTESLLASWLVSARGTTWAHCAGGAAGPSVSISGSNTGHLPGRSGG